MLRSSSLHRLGLAGNALGTDGAVHLILAAELGRELETKFTESGAGGLSSAYLGIILLYNYTISYLYTYTILIILLCFYVYAQYRFYVITLEHALRNHGTITSHV